MIRHCMLTALVLITFSQTQACNRRINPNVTPTEVDYAKLQEAARQTRLERIAEYEAVLSQDSVQGDQRASLVFRLAEQYFLEGKYYYFMEMEAFETEYDACFNTTGCDVNSMSPNQVQSQQWQQKAIAQYQRILQDHPQYPRMDEVIFMLASALQEMGLGKDAVAYFERLTQTYPQSIHLPQAYVNIGEYYFDNNSAMKALAAYKKAAEFQKAKTYGYAMYKLAWCYYNVQRYDLAIDSMQRVIAFCENQNAAEEGNTTSRTLQEEALKDMVRFYADTEDMMGAELYFSQLGQPKLILQVVRRISAIYMEQGKFEEAIKGYRNLLYKEPMNPKAPDYQYKIIQAFEKMNQKAETLQEIQKLRSTYHKDSAWGRENAANTDAITRANRHVEAALRTAATEYHKESRKLTDPSEAISVSKQAEQAYRLYLEDYPSETYSYDIRYNFGELLFDLGDYYKKNKSKDTDGTLQEKYYVDAFNQYSRVIEEQPQGKYAQQCANANITLAYNMFQIEVKKGRLVYIPKRRGDLEVIDLGPWEGKYLKAMEDYAELYPESKETIHYLYDAGFRLFEKNRLDEAVVLFRKVIAIKPTSKQAGNAAKDIVNALAFRADAMFATERFDEAMRYYVALRDAATDFHENKELGDARFKDLMYQYFEKATAKIAELKK